MELHFILVFMLLASIAAIQMRDLISSVISLSAVGLGLCLAFLLLKASNLAITQLVVEILCVVILIRATIKKDLPLVRDGRWLFNTIATFLFVACFLFFAVLALRELPVFGLPLMRVSGEYLKYALAESNPINIVTIVALNFRGLDALIEASLLFAAVVGVLVIARKTGKINEG